MRREWKFPIVAGLGAGLVAVLAAAQTPVALSATRGGLWEIDPVGPGPRLRQCVADPLALTSLEDRGRPCSRTVVNAGPSSALVEFTCRGGAFGQSQITVLTPRSLRIDSQGIADGGPFRRVINARRMGDC